MGYIRRASHAGSWYSSEPAELGSQLQGWLDNARGRSAGSSATVARAVIAPHAGYSYSGETAAYAYVNLNPAQVKRVFIMGPSHHIYLRGCAVSTATKLRTPLRDLEVDSVVTNSLLATGSFTEMGREVDEDEHSIELHLPYIAKVLGEAEYKVVAIMVGSTSEAQDKAYGELLAPYLSDPGNFFVISSDFCHWGSRFRYQPHDSARGPIHAYIRWLDHEGMSLIEALDLKGFYSYLREYGNTICGRHPICTFMQAMLAFQRSTPEPPEAQFGYRPLLCTIQPPCAFFLNPAPVSTICLTLDQMDSANPTNCLQRITSA
ncbi:unnamed protein product [Chrysoparadoxa australica]